MENKTNLVLVHEFDHYRDYLVAQFQFHKNRQPRLNWSMFARAMGLQDTSSITKIINGQRHPGEDVVKKMVEYFQLSDKDTQYFRTLIYSARSEEQSKIAKNIIHRDRETRENLIPVCYLVCRDFSF